MTETVIDAEDFAAREQHRRTSDISKRNEARKEARLATKHTIEDIRFSAPLHVLCSCGWHATPTSSSESESLWKGHKAEWRERTA